MTHVSPWIKRITVAEHLLLSYNRDEKPALASAIDLADAIRADEQPLEMLAACWHVVGDNGQRALEVLRRANQIISMGFRAKGKGKPCN